MIRKSKELRNANSKKVLNMKAERNIHSKY